MAFTKPAPIIRLHKPDLSVSLAGTYDRELVERAQAGDADAFARLFDAYSGRVFRYMRFHVGDDRLAEDLTARVYAKTWSSLPCYELDRPPFGAWLYMIAREAVIDFSKSHDGEGKIKEILSPTERGLEEYEHTPPCQRDMGATEPESEPE